MSDLTEQERETLDKLNKINMKLVENPCQSLWNVCWGYLKNKFTTNLIFETPQQIKKVLAKINEEAPKIKTEENLTVSTKEMYSTVAMNPLF